MPEIPPFRPLGDSFNAAKDGKSSTQTPSPGSTTKLPHEQGISTKAELDHLNAKTTTPKPSLDYKPGGSVQRDVDKEVARQDNMRKAFLEQSLSNAGKTVRRDFDKSR